MILVLFPACFAWFNVRIIEVGLVMSATYLGSGSLPHTHTHVMGMGQVNMLAILTSKEKDFVMTKACVWYPCGIETSVNNSFHHCTGHHSVFIHWSH